jgi:ABC-type dipeptide/oligopeptide/nickel transport system permease component
MSSFWSRIVIGAVAVPIVLGIVVLNFFLLHLAPGDAATVLAGERPASYSAELSTGR